MARTETPAAVLTEAQARSAWVRHQGLGGRAGEPLEETVAATGWVRTIGGVDGYLSLAARQPGLTAAAVHAAVARRDLQVLPSVRGCIYLVPRAHAALALSIAHDLSARRDARDAGKAGISPGELDAVGEAVLAALADGPQTTPGLRKVLPDGTIRSLGAAGKKVGLSSTLPPALRVLEFAGRIVRQPVDDRLDSERYAWALGDPAALTDDREAAARQAELIGLLLSWFGPVSIDELAAFSGLGKRVTRAGLAAQDAVPVAVQGRGGVSWLTPAQLEAVEAAVPQRTVLLPAMDTLLAWHGGPSVFVHPDDRDRRIPVWGRQKGDTWATVTHPMARVVFTGGQVRGRWEFDPDARAVVSGPYAPGLPEDLGPVAAETTALLREIGHGLPYSIATDDDLRKRAAEVRAL